MAFPKKKSRRIIVDNMPYRCVVGPNDGYNFFYAHIDQEEHGRIIEVLFPIEINKLWGLFSKYIRFEFIYFETEGF